MNKELIEDEKSGNTMNTAQLEKRMNEFLSGGYSAYFFIEDSNVIGYALVKKDIQPPYLRQFFICREQRRKHYGKMAFEALMQHLQTDIINIDVLPWNERGIAFWKSCGFNETCISMRYTKK